MKAITTGVVGAGYGDGGALRKGAVLITELISTCLVGPYSSMVPSFSIEVMVGKFKEAIWSSVKQQPCLKKIWLNLHTGGIEP